MINFLIRAAACLFLGLLSMLLIPFGTGIPPLTSMLLWPGRVILTFANHIFPASWIYGDPASNEYMPDISSAGFAMLSSWLFWSLIFLIAWEILRIKVLAKIENS